MSEHVHGCILRRCLSADLCRSGTRAAALTVVGCVLLIIRHLRQAIEQCRRAADGTHLPLLDAAVAQSAKLLLMFVERAPLLVGAHHSERGGERGKSGAHFTVERSHE